MNRKPITARAVLAAGVLAAALAAAACSSPQESSPPALAFDKTLVKLGAMEQDSQAVVTFLAINYGAVPINVGPVAMTAVQGDVAGKSLQEAIRVDPQAVYPVQVRIGPFNELGPHKIQAKVSSTDPMARSSTLTIDLTVVEAPPPPAKGPRLRVDKQLIDSGIVPLDWPAYEQFTLRNDGDAPLVLKGTPVLRVELGC